MSANTEINNPNGLSDPELESRLWATLNKELEEQAKKNIPQVFRNELCVKANQFIHKYPDGSMFLIEQDQNNSSEIIRKQLEWPE